MNLKNVIRRSTAGISALCIAGTYLAAGSFEAVNAATVTLYGDFNCDGVVDLNDVIELSKYLKAKPSVPNGISLDKPNSLIEHLNTL